MWHCLLKYFSIRTKIARARFRLKPQIETFTRFLVERLERIGFGYCHHSFWWIHYKDNTGCQGFNKLQFPSLAFLILTYLCWSVLKLHTYNDYSRTHVLSHTHTITTPASHTHTHTPTQLFPFSTFIVGCTRYIEFSMRVRGRAERVAIISRCIGIDVKKYATANAPHGCMWW